MIGAKLDLRPCVVEELVTTPFRRFTSSTMTRSRSPRHREPGRVQVLRRALDGAQRVADLVREAGGHLAQRRQAVALLHALEELQFSDHRRPLGDLQHRGDLVGAVGLGHAVVPEVPEAEHTVAAPSAERDPGATSASWRPSRPRSVRPRGRCPRRPRRPRSISPSLRSTTSRSSAARPPRRRRAGRGRRRPPGTAPASGPRASRRRKPGRSSASR